MAVVLPLKIKLTPWQITCIANIGVQLHIHQHWKIDLNNESDKGSGISAPNSHHSLRSGRCSERYPIVWRTLARDGTRRGVPEGLVPVVYGMCERGGSTYGNRPETNTTRKARNARKRNAPARRRNDGVSKLKTSGAPVFLSQKRSQ